MIFIRLTIVGKENPHHLAELRQIVLHAIEYAKTLPVPGDLLLLERERGIPPAVYHVNRRILHQSHENSEWEFVLENGADGLLVGREFIQRVVEDMVKGSSKRVLNEQQQVTLICDTIYDALKGRVIYG